MPSAEFFSDDPINDQNDDILNRQPFCEALAQGITNSFNTSKSIVMGLEGKWGDGKTSILNLTKQKLDPSIHVIDFNPWRYTEKSQINFTQAFFDNLQRNIQKKTTGQEDQQVAASIAKYAAILQVTNQKHAPSGILKTLFTGLAIILGIMPSLINPVIEYKSIVIWSFYATAIIFATIPFWMHVIHDFLLRRAAQKTDIDFLKKQIQNSIQKSKIRILIIIDNLDRATASEIYELTQIVKVNGDFANTVYLLCYDVEIVSSQLRNGVNLHGFEYLKKIIQIQIPVPTAPPARIEEYLQQKFNEILSKTGIDHSAILTDNYRLRIFHLRLQPLILNLRDLKRIFNGFEYKLHIVCAAKSNELNPLELFCMEIIYNSWPELYYFIRNQRVLFTGGSVIDRLSVKNNEKKGLVHTRMESFFSNDESKGKEKYLPLLFELFPEIANAYGHGHGHSTEGRGVDFRSISTERYFPVYFNLAGEGSIDGVAEHEIDELRKSIAMGSEAILSGLHLFIEENKIASILFRVEELAEDSKFIADSSIKASIEALYDIMPRLIEIDEPVFTRLSYTALRICRKLLMRLKHLSQSDAVMDELIRFSPNYIAAAEQLSFEEQVNLKNPQNRIFSDDALVDLKKKWVSLVSFGVDSTTVNRIQPLRRILIYFQRWDSHLLEIQMKKLLSWSYGLVVLLSAFLIEDEKNPSNESKISEFMETHTIDFEELRKYANLLVLKNHAEKYLDENQVYNRSMLQFFVKKLPLEIIAKDFGKELEDSK